MRLSYVLIAAALVLIPPTVLAGGDEILTLDLKPAGGPTLFLSCSKGTGFTGAGCGVVQVWQQANPIPGLQRTIMSYNAMPWEPDVKLLG